MTQHLGMTKVMHNVELVSSFKSSSGNTNVHITPERMSLPCRKGLEVVVSHVQNSEARMPRQHGHTFVCEPVIGQIKLLEDAVAFL